MKKFIYPIFLALTLILFSTLPAWADDIYSYNKDLPKDAFLDSVILSQNYSRYLAQGEIKTGEKPLEFNDRLFLPLRQMGEAFGAKVDWDQKANKATVTLGERKVTFVPGNKYLDANGQRIQLDVNARMIKNRIYIPLRALGEALGKSVDYIAEGKWVCVYGKSFDIHRFLQNTDRFEIALQGLPAIYGDNIITAYKNTDDRIHIKFRYGQYIVGREYPNDYDYRFFSTESGDYLVFYYMGLENGYAYYIYSLKGDKIEFICHTSWAQEIKFHKGYAYVLHSFYAGCRDLPNENSSNLERINLKDGTGEYIGMPGYVYGLKLFTKDDYVIKEFTSWEVKDDGIYISGLDYNAPGVLDKRHEPNDVYTKEAINLVANYRVDLTGNNHEKIQTSGNYVI